MSPGRLFKTSVAIVGAAGLIAFAASIGEQRRPRADGGARGGLAGTVVGDPEGAEAPHPALASTVARSKAKRALVRELIEARCLLAEAVRGFRDIDATAPFDGLTITRVQFPGLPDDEVYECLVLSWARSELRERPGRFRALCRRLEAERPGLTERLHRFGIDE